MPLHIVYCKVPHGHNPLGAKPIGKQEQPEIFKAVLIKAALLKKQTVSTVFLRKHYKKQTQCKTKLTFMIVMLFSWQS